MKIIQLLASILLLTSLTYAQESMRAYVFFARTPARRRKASDFFRLPLP